MTDKTPVGIANVDEIEEIFEEILQDTPVELKLKHGASSKGENWYLRFSAQVGGYYVLEL